LPEELLKRVSLALFFVKQLQEAKPRQFYITWAYSQNTPGPIKSSVFQMPRFFKESTLRDCLIFPDRGARWEEDSI
jgi:hypothetical protein